MLTIFFPPLLLILASLGLGGAVLLPLQRFLPQFPVWIHASVAYFLGQGILASGFLMLALAKLFTPGVIFVLLIPGVFAGLYFIWSTALQWRTCIRDATQDWWETPFCWKILSILALLIFALGFTTLGGWIEGDPIAFYFALPKVTAYSHQLVSLPGYESFMNVGLLAEMLIASLMSIGMPNVSPRIFSWVNQIPTLALFYGLARCCGLGWRGGLLAIIVPLTSSAAILLWGDAKTDLYAVGPSLACCILALASWDRKNRWCLIVLSGVFCGFACVFKLSYLLPLVPMVVLLIAWKQLFLAVQAFRDKAWLEISRLFRLELQDARLFVIGFTVAFFPHILKNLYLLDTILGSTIDGAWYAPATITRLLLSYPLALTYGRYWAQLGDLSPLVLAFVPLVTYLPRPSSWGESKLGALTFATLVGLILWMILMPSIFMPRYFLSTLLLLGIPAAAGAEYFSRKSGVASATVFLATAITLVATPAHVGTWSKLFDFHRTLEYLANPENELLVSAPQSQYCVASRAINALATPNDRVFMLTYYRFWLRPDLILNASTQKDLGYLLGGPFWERLKEVGFRFILVDTSLFPVGKELISSKPGDIVLRELSSGGTLAAYEVVQSEHK